jgi:hypothetical protein
MTNSTSWCINNLACSYFKNNVEYVFIIVLFVSFLSVILILLVRSIPCLQKIWSNDIEITNYKRIHTIRLRVNYLKIVSIFFGLMLIFVLARLFFQIFDIHSETEYIIAILFVVGIAVVNLIKKIINLFVLLFTSKIKYNCFYDFGNGYKGIPTDVDFYHVNLQDVNESGKYHSIPIASFLETTKYSYKTDFIKNPLKEVVTPSSPSIETTNKWNIK